MIFFSIRVVLKYFFNFDLLQSHFTFCFCHFLEKTLLMVEFKLASCLFEMTTLPSSPPPLPHVRTSLLCTAVKNNFVWCYFYCSSSWCFVFIVCAFDQLIVLLIRIDSTEPLDTPNIFLDLVLDGDVVRHFLSEQLVPWHSLQCFGFFIEFSMEISFF